MLYSVERWARNIIGILIGLLFGIIYGKFMNDLHENSLYFSQIKEVERLISMRTESGFYYSFYGQLVNAKYINKGLKSLLNDTKSEYPKSINALQRFNIYPEVVTALVYKLLKPLKSLPFKLPTPIFFYANTCFSFSGLAITATYFLSWVYSGDWIYGIISATWLLVNYEDSGRTNFVLNLRENWALPFLWFQMVFVIKALRNPVLFNLFSTFMFTFLFCICWQFSQFVLLLQSCALFVVCLLRPECLKSIRNLLLSQNAALFLNMIFHFFNQFYLTAPVLWLNFSIILCTNVKFNTTNSINPFYILKTSILTVISFVILFTSIRIALNVQVDSHVFTFFLAKFGVVLSDVPFETAIYLCNAAFSFTGYDFIERVQKNGIIQLYVLVIVVFVILLTFNYCTGRELASAEQIFVVVSSILFAIMAYTTMRMKYVFLPQMAIVSASFFGLLDRHVDRYFGRSKMFFKYAVILAISAKLLTDHYAFYQKVMSREQEFYDPDTVQLMEFINKESRKNVYSGSMQLMAGVKACTSRSTTNHPHFEDKALRDRTLRIYSMYAKLPIEQVYQILKEENATHIIVENSICFTKSTGCALKDVVDTAYGHRTESGLQPFHSKNDYKTVAVDRFCNSIMKSTQSLFIRVFNNRTFRIYRLA